MAAITVSHHPDTGALLLVSAAAAWAKTGGAWGRGESVRGVELGNREREKGLGGWGVGGIGEETTGDKYNKNERQTGIRLDGKA